MKPSGSDEAVFYTDPRDHHVKEWAFDGQRCPDCDRVLQPVDGVRAACQMCGQVFHDEKRLPVTLGKTFGARLALTFNADD